MIKKRFLSMLVLLAAVVTGAWAQTAYTITLPSVSNGSVSAKVNDASVTSAEADATVSLVATPDAGYRLKTISGTYQGAPEETFQKGDTTGEGTYFRLVASASNNAGWRFNTGSESTITITSTQEGTLIDKVELSITTGVSFNFNTITVSSGTKTINGNVITITGINNTTLTITGTGNAAQGCTVQSATITGTTEDKALSLTSTGDDNVKTFTMPSGNVTISAEFEPAPAASTYTVTLKDGTDDATSWTIAPDEATTTGVAAGTEVKATYGGAKKVKSVKAKKMSPIISLSGRNYLDDELVIANGYIVTGSATAFSCKVAVADGATVTLRDVENDNGSLDPSSACPGIRCIGDATIILEGNNTVKGSGMYAGIYVPEGKTLTIRGTGSLTVTGGSGGAGIGGNSEGNCGSIVISGGNITATGGSHGAGIGLGYTSGCEFGDITISGGTVTATGSGNAPGIGGPEAYFQNITITDDVTKVTVNKGSNSTYSIGTSEIDEYGYYGAITIGGTVYFNDGSFENGGDSYLQTSPLVYQP